MCQVAVFDPAQTEFQGAFQVSGLLCMKISVLSNSQMWQHDAARMLPLALRLPV